jgi:hypothetical protein
MAEQIASMHLSCLRHPPTACGLAAGGMVQNKGARETEVEGNEPLEISDYYITNIIFFTWAHKG